MSIYVTGGMSKLNPEKNPEHFFFKHPFTCIIAGPTQSGKTQFTKNLLTNCQKLIKPVPTRVIWCYGQVNDSQSQAIQNDVKLRIDFVEGIPEEFELDKNENNVIVLDDLMHEVGGSNKVAKLFTKKSHHENLTVLLLIQNLFHQNKNMRDLMLNSKYLVLFKNPRDKCQVRYLSTQINPSDTNYVLDAYSQATARPHGYLIFDFDQKTPDEKRLITGIFPNELYIRYIPKKKIM